MARLFALFLVLLPSAASAASLDDLIDGLSALVEPVGASPATRADYETFVARHNLTATDALYDDFVKVKIAFEATRAGGFWAVQWTVTNKEPQSDAVWDQWSRMRGPYDDWPTALAECDELSALFAFVGRRMGVDGLGLMWPTWNHTVAVWSVGKARIVLPTSQVFLDATETFDTDGFDPWTQKTIYTYTRADADGSIELNDDVCKWMIDRVRKQAPASFTTLQLVRNLREMRLAGLASERQVRWKAEERLATELPTEDAEAIRAFLEELGRG
ncbi:MAG: hypothetical protein GY898_17650 [Proteobacteria bacterium]|nr:hypothetical protein [Pseudomonadota bacterium]